MDYTEKTVWSYTPEQASRLRKADGSINGARRKLEYCDENGLQSARRALKLLDEVWCIQQGAWPDGCKAFLDHEKASAIGMLRQKLLDAIQSIERDPFKNPYLISKQALRQDIERSQRVSDTLSAIMGLLEQRLCDEVGVHPGAWVLHRRIPGYVQQVQNGTLRIFFPDHLRVALKSIKYQSLLSQSLPVIQQPDGLPFGCPSFYLLGNAWMNLCRAQGLLNQDLKPVALWALLHAAASHAVQAWLCEHESSFRLPDVHSPECLNQAFREAAPSSVTNVVMTLQEQLQHCYSRCRSVQAAGDSRNLLADANKLLDRCDGMINSVFESLPECVRAQYTLSELKAFDWNEFYYDSEFDNEGLDTSEAEDAST